MRALPLLILIAVLPPSAALGFSTPLSSNSGVGCQPCHGTSSGPSLEITLIGPDEVPAGGRARYTVMIPSMLAGGSIDLGISSTSKNEGWALEPVDETLHSVANGNLVHSDPLLGMWAYEFDLLAPSVDSAVTLRIAMLAFNDDGMTANDLWNNATAAIVTPEPGTAGILLAMSGALAAIARSRRQTAFGGRR